MFNRSVSGTMMLWLLSSVAHRSCSAVETSPPLAVRRQHSRRLPGEIYDIDFDMNDLDAAEIGFVSGMVFMLVMLLLLCCCCCRRGCSVCDLIALICLWDLCCDRGGPPGDFIAIVWSPKPCCQSWWGFWWKCMPRGWEPMHQYRHKVWCMFMRHRKRDRRIWIMLMQLLRRYHTWRQQSSKI